MARIPLLRSQAARRRVLREDAVYVKAISAAAWSELATVRRSSTPTGKSDYDPEGKI